MRLQSMGNIENRSKIYRMSVSNKFNGGKNKRGKKTGELGWEVRRQI